MASWTRDCLDTESDEEFRDPECREPDGKNAPRLASEDEGEVVPVWLAFVWPLTLLAVLAVWI